jgi:hypothetical protein
MGQRRGLRPQHLDPLLQREQRALVLVDRHANDQSIDQLQRPTDDVEMPVGDRIEGARIEADALHAGLRVEQRLGA